MSDALRLRAVKAAREVFESSTGVSSAFTALADALERAYRAEEDLLSVAQAMGYSYAPDTGPDAPAPTELLVEKAREHAAAHLASHELYEAIERLEEERDGLARSLRVSQQVVAEQRDRLQRYGRTLERIGDEPRSRAELSEWDHADVYNHLAEFAQLARDTLARAK